MVIANKILRRIWQVEVLDQASQDHDLNSIYNAKT